MELLDRFFRFTQNRRIARPDILRAFDFYLAAKAKDPGIKDFTI